MLSRLWHSDNQSFNPRSPRGGATLDIIRKAVRHAVSIHAPHEGERLIRVDGSAEQCQFQSTLPTRGSDFFFAILPPSTSVSIHAPHEGERHSCIVAPNPLVTSFNPRSPRGGATGNTTKRRAMEGVSIHAPHEGERRWSRARCYLRL